MKSLLDTIAPFKKQALSTGIFSDLDGTLSKIAPSPGDARIGGDIKRLLERLQAAYKLVAIVTGRDSCNAAGMVGLNNLIYVGNHGLEVYDGYCCEIAPDASKYLEIAERATRELVSSEVLAGINGLQVEGKRFGVAVHYRKASDKEIAKKCVESIAKPLAARYGFRIAHGKNVIELKPKTGCNKGTAVRELSEKHHLENVLYFGDDTTDIDAFVELRKMREEAPVKTLSVAVYSSEVDRQVVEKADFTIAGIEEMPGVFERLL
jgi:trehalose 6-phosphate phosphatase